MAKQFAALDERAPGSTQPAGCPCRPVRWLLLSSRESSRVLPASEEQKLIKYGVRILPARVAEDLHCSRRQDKLPEGGFGLTDLYCLKEVNEARAPAPVP